MKCIFMGNTYGHCFFSSLETRRTAALHCFMVGQNTVLLFIVMLVLRSSQASAWTRWMRRTSVPITRALHQSSAFVPSRNFTVGMPNVSYDSIALNTSVRATLTPQRLFSTAVPQPASSTDQLTTDILNWVNKETTGSATLFGNSTEASVKRLMDYFNTGGKLPSDLVVKVLDESTAMHLQQPNVLQLSRPRSANSTTESPQYSGKLTIVGDTHGQYEDFATIFELPELAGYPSELNQFVFNGDVVDRGPQAVEILMVLLFAKLLRPDCVHILRGNHETISMSHHFGFFKEVLGKYDQSVYFKFTRFFDTLPIAAVVENSAFVVHGGIGPQTVQMSIEDINKVNRFEEPEGGPLSELLWSDPKDQMTGFRANKARGGGTVLFGADVTQSFLARNKLHYIVRSHEVEMQGYRSLHDGLCITVFSAPNYCGDVGNLGAVVRYDQPDSMKPTIVQFAPASFVKKVRAEKAQELKDNQQ